MMYPNTDRDFMTYVVKTSYCWLWLGPRWGGYGHFIKMKRPEKAHRAAFRIKYGSIPKGKIICHKCDNPLCVRPSHLFAGTHKENTGDMFKKGRENKARGERSHCAKLNSKQVLEIRRDFVRGNKYHPGNKLELCKKYNLCPKSIWLITRRKTWSHI